MDLPAQLLLARRIMKELAAFFLGAKYTNACVGMSMMLHEELQVGYPLWELGGYLRTSKHTELQCANLLTWFWG